MRSRDLRLSPTWQDLAPKITAKHAAGEHFEDMLEMNIAIKMRTLQPYAEHYARLEHGIWVERRLDTNPPTVIDLGGGYGAMLNFWPNGSTVIMLDFPAMLAIQHRYASEVAGDRLNVLYVPYDEVDRIVFDRHDTYLFSAWALTETTSDTWAYYIERAQDLAGAYVVGHDKWEDLPQWPFDGLAMQFERANLYPVENGVRLEAWRE